MLDDARTTVVSWALVSLGTAEAAWPSFTGTAAPDREMVCMTTVNCGVTDRQSGACKPSMTWRRKNENPLRKSPLWLRQLRGLKSFKLFLMTLVRNTTCLGDADCENPRVEGSVDSSMAGTAQ